MAALLALATWDVVGAASSSFGDDSVQVSSPQVRIRVVPFVRCAGEFSMWRVKVEIQGSGVSGQTTHQLF